MGRGDARTRKGKTFKGSYGNTRPKTPGKAKPAMAAAKKGTAGRVR
jgi:ribosomal small subunit protein bTHX